MQTTSRTDFGKGVRGETTGGREERDWTNCTRPSAIEPAAEARNLAKDRSLRRLCGIYAEEAECCTSPKSPGNKSPARLTPGGELMAMT